MLRPFLSELRRRDSLLATVAIGHLLLAVVCGLLMLVDGREITGVNAWIKPFKFAVSIALYAATFAWLLELLGTSRWRRWLSRTVALCMVVEILCIVGQAARGTTSHYNIATPVDAAIFSAMGLFIGLNSAVAGLFLVLLLVGWRRVTERAESFYVVAVCLALVLFLVGSYGGVMMVSNMGHTIGADDAGPGLPLVDWSREGGDLRIGHALGLHAIQVLPLLAWLLLRSRGAARWRGAALVLVTLAYTAMTLGATLLALRGCLWSPCDTSTSARSGCRGALKIGENALS